MNAEKENTWRALQDQPPIVSSFWCRLGWHKWTKWTQIKKSSSSIYSRQERECVHCSIYQENKIDTR